MRGLQAPRGAEGAEKATAVLQPHPNVNEFRVAAGAGRNEGIEDLIHEVLKMVIAGQGLRI